RVERGSAPSRQSRRSDAPPGGMVPARIGDTDLGSEAPESERLQDRPLEVPGLGDLHDHGVVRRLAPRLDPTHRTAGIRSGLFEHLPEEVGANVIGTTEGAEMTTGG